MGVIYGQVMDKENKPMEGAYVVLEDRDFEPIFQTLTDAEGRYQLEAPDGEYPFLFIVRDYGEKNLEYWCNNILLQEKLEVNCQIDKLEIYGVHVFEIKGAAPALTVYFRPMSLVKVLNAEKDIVPDITEESLTFMVNGEKCDLLLMNRVKEYTSEVPLNAFLVQIARPKKLQGRNKLDIRMVDEQGNLGMASLFFSLD